MANTCPGCRERDALSATLQQQVAALRAELRGLKLRLGPDATNSSIPPSANPPAGRKPVVKAPTGGLPGEQLAFHHPRRGLSATGVDDQDLI
jgi:hypothetical protein